MNKTLIFIAFGALLLSACAPRIGDTIEQTMELVEEMVAKDINPADMVEGELEESEASSQDFVTWEYYNFPSQFPDYTDGRIQKSFMLQDSYPVIVGIEDTSVQAIEDYVQRAINDGFVLLWEREAQGDEDLGWAVSKSTDGEHYSIMLSYYEDFYGLPDFVNIVVDVR